MIRLPLAVLGHRSRAGSPDSVGGGRPRACCSARLCARQGRAARSPGSAHLLRLTWGVSLSRVRSLANADGRWRAVGPAPRRGRERRVELAVDGTHAECAAERRRRPHLSPPRAPPRQCGFQVRARLRPGDSGPGQPHIRSAHTAAAPQSRVRRVGLRRARPFLFPALEATQQIGSPTWIRQDLIRVLPNANAAAGALRRPSSPRPR